MTFKCTKPANQQTLQTNKWTAPPQNPLSPGHAVPVAAAVGPKSDKFGRISFKFEVYRKGEDSAAARQRNQSIEPPSSSEYGDASELSRLLDQHVQNFDATTKSESGKIVFTNKLTRQDSNPGLLDGVAAATQASMPLGRALAETFLDRPKVLAGSKIQEQLASIIQKRRAKVRQAAHQQH